jgi:Flp pilus assembly protein CpaB
MRTLGLLAGTWWYLATGCFLAPLPEEKKVPVLVARQDIPAFTRVKEPEKFFEVRLVPMSQVQKGALATFDTVRDLRLFRKLPAGSMVTPDDLVGPDLHGGSHLVPGRRAIAVKISGESVCRASPGARVDIVWTPMRGGLEPEPVTILRNMLVLAVEPGTALEGNQALQRNVTFQAKPEEASRLLLADSLGELSLTRPTLEGEGPKQAPNGEKK